MCLEIATRASPCLEVLGRTYVYKSEIKSNLLIILLVLRENKFSIKIMGIYLSCNKLLYILTCIYIVHRPARERELSTDIFPVRER